MKNTFIGIIGVIGLIVPETRLAICGICVAIGVLGQATVVGYFNTGWEWLKGLVKK